MNYSELYLRKCNYDDLEQIMQLQDEIIEQMEDKTLLRYNNIEMFLECMELPNVVFGVFNRTELIAITVLFVPNNNEDSISELLINNIEGKAINYKLVLVKREYRGLGLQRALLWLSEKFASFNGYEVMCATVSPKNEHSLNNMLSAGFLVDHERMMYNNLFRMVLAKNIRNSIKKYCMEAEHFIKLKNKEGNMLSKVINYKKCFRGDIGMILPGDIIEYQNSISHEKIYGVYMYNKKPMIYINDLSSSRMILCDFSKKIDGFLMNEVYINVDKNGFL